MVFATPAQSRPRFASVGPRCPGRTRPGFTLIELLVVIAVIALLIGILLPALGKARATAKSARCLSGVRQMGLAFTLYANDSKNWYPLIPFNQTAKDRWAGKSTNGNRRNLDQQWINGGLAGLFSLNQLGDPTYPSYKPVWVGGDVGEGDAAEHYADKNSTPLMRRYIDGLSALTCPSDRRDPVMNHTQNNYSPASTNALVLNHVPKPPGGEHEVVYYNISYLYFAGLKTDESVIVTAAPIFGDETNGNDLTTNAYYNGDGLFRNDDNHGNEGGQYVFTDGHGAFVKSTPGDTIQQRFFGNGNTQAQSINVIDKYRSERIQTLD
ncbi:MAG: type II secretion system protein [Phycisphaerales bacterium]|nr:type II secretion system protein [Phycisphaerales bacterium]